MCPNCKKVEDFPETGQNITHIMLCVECKKELEKQDDKTPCPVKINFPAYMK